MKYIYQFTGFIIEYTLIRKQIFSYTFIYLLFKASYKN